MTDKISILIGWVIPWCNLQYSVYKFTILVSNSVILLRNSYCDVIFYVISPLVVKVKLKNTFYELFFYFYTKNVNCKSSSMLYSSK